MLSAENLASIESEGRRLGLAARREPSRAVPQYPDWALSDLISHTAGIHARTVLVCRDLPQDRISVPKLPVGIDPIDWYEQTLDEMLAELTIADPTTKVWAFGVGGDLGFWERRMVIETGVHRWDAYNAYDEEDRLTDVTAVSGLEEFGAMWLGHLGDVQPLKVTVQDMGRSWVFGGNEPTVEVAGTASEIYLRLMSRPSRIALPEDWTAAVDALAPTPKPTPAAARS